VRRHAPAVVLRIHEVIPFNGQYGELAAHVKCWMLDPCADISVASLKFAIRFSVPFPVHQSCSGKDFDLKVTSKGARASVCVVLKCCVCNINTDVERLP